MRTLETFIKLTPTLVGTLRQCGFQPLWLRDHPGHRRAFIETPASALGKALHAALAEFHRMGGAETYTRADLNALLRSYWPGEGFTDAEEERLAGGLESGDLSAVEGPWCQWGCPVKAAGQCPLFPPAVLDGEWE